MMYLADLPEFIPAEQGAFVQQRLKEIFGATDEDYAQLRLSGVGSGKDDGSVLEAMITEKGGATAKEGGAESGADVAAPDSMTMTMPPPQSDDVPPVVDGGEAPPAA